MAKLDLQKRIRHGHIFDVAAVVGFVGSFRITRGEKYNPMLKLNTSMVFREKEQKYKNIVRINF